MQGLPPRQPRTSPPGQTDTSPRLAPWLPLTRNQADRFVAITSRGAWVGIAALVIFWVTVRFIGPAAGWWTLADG
jgi:fatty acid desaturase